MRIFDEIGELPLSLQGKLLRFLQTQTFYPIGGTKEIQVNVRDFCDKQGFVGNGQGKEIQEDLYYRLRVTTIHIPPLRDRKEDIISLLQFFINCYRHTAPRQIIGITKAFFKKMAAYDWPGNIRELENTIRSAIALSKTHYLTTYELKELAERSFPKSTAFSGNPCLRINPVSKGCHSK